MTRGQIFRRLLIVVVGVMGLGSAVTWGGPASATDGVRVSAAVDNQELAKSSVSRPAALQSARPAVMSVAVTNGSGSPILVRSVRLQGRVIGLTMFSYEARIDLPVQAGATETVTYEIELVDLSHQAVGYIPARVELLDAKRNVIATQHFASDVQGSARSVYGLFGLTIVALTGVLFASAVVRLAGHRLPANRWKRATRFGVVGLGAGLTITFTLSAFRLLFPAPGLWVTLLLVGGGGMFLFGYLTPTPDDLPPETEDSHRGRLDESPERAY